MEYLKLDNKQPAWHPFPRGNSLCLCAAWLGHQQIKEDVSSTHRAPYPSESGLPRHKMK